MKHCTIFFLGRMAVATTSALKNATGMVSTSNEMMTHIRRRRWKGARENYSYRKGEREGGQERGKEKIDQDRKTEKKNGERKYSTMGDGGGGNMDPSMLMQEPTLVSHCRPRQSWILRAKTLPGCSLQSGSILLVPEGLHSQAPWEP